jgi:hypothetical protein
MRKNILFIILSIATILSLFATAAVCSFCGMKLDTAPQDESFTQLEETETDLVEEESAEDKTTNNTQEINTTQQDTEGEAPTIKLKISEGPTYSAADDVCYYRITAAVTGSPTPKIEWSKDYSNGTLGEDVAQINLTRDNPTYALTATATNPAGSATDSITLSWGCDAPEAKPIVKDIAVEKSISGYIIVDDQAFSNPTYSFVGDYSNDKEIYTFLTFSISDLLDKKHVTIKDVSVTIPVDEIVGHPQNLTQINVFVTDYGNSLELADQYKEEVWIQTLLPTDSLTNLNFSNSTLNIEMQKAVDAGKQRIQLTLWPVSYTPNASGDYYRFTLTNINMRVKYEVSE